MALLQLLTAEWIAVLALRWALIIIFVGFAIAKFPASEAAGFAEYVRPHPVLRWGPRLLGARLFSIAVALAELAVAAMLFLGTFSATLGFLGAWAVVAEMAVTLSLLLFTDRWQEQNGFPFLGEGAEFLIKDAAIAAAGYMLAVHEGARLLAG
ncbi:MAG: DUF417 family protein [Rhodobacteraceae bacterium]|nr:DUF417 family protein [Paracoccaceae bacterium]